MNLPYRLCFSLPADTTGQLRLPAFLDDVASRDNPKAPVVLAGLCCIAQSGFATVDPKAMAGQLKCSPNAVRKCLRHLAKLGHIEFVGQMEVCRG